MVFTNIFPPMDILSGPSLGNSFLISCVASLPTCKSSGSSAHHAASGPHCCTWLLKKKASGGPVWITDNLVLVPYWCPILHFQDFSVGLARAGVFSKDKQNSYEFQGTHYQAFVLHVKFVFKYNFNKQQFILFFWSHHCIITQFAILLMNIRWSGFPYPVFILSCSVSLLIYYSVCTFVA